MAKNFDFDLNKNPKGFKDWKAAVSAIYKSLHLIELHAHGGEEGGGEDEVPGPGFDFNLFVNLAEDNTGTVSFTSNMPLTGIDIQFRPCFNFVINDELGGALAENGFNTSLYQDEENNWIKIVSFSFNAVSLDATEEPVILYHFDWDGDPSQLEELGSPVSSCRATSDVDVAGLEGTVNDYQPDGVVNIMDVIFIVNDSIGFYGTKEITSQAQLNEEFFQYCVSGPENTGTIDLVTGTCAIFNNPDNILQPNSKQFVDIGTGTTETWCPSDVIADKWQMIPCPNIPDGESIYTDGFTAIVPEDGAFYEMFSENWPSGCYQIIASTVGGPTVEDEVQPNEECSSCWDEE